MHKNKSYALSETQKAALKKLGALLLYLHGSIAEERAHRDSDVDAAVLFEKMPENPIEMTGEIIHALRDFVPGTYVRCHNLK